MVLNEELWNLYEQTQDGCDNKCSSCPLYLKDKQMCVHEADRKWEEWNRKRHAEFGELLRSYEK